MLIIGTRNFDLISFGKIDFIMGRFATHNALANTSKLIHRNTAGGGFGIVFDFCLTCRAATPPGISPAVLNDFLKLGIILWLMDVGVAEFCGTVKKGCLNLI